MSVTPLIDPAMARSGSADAEMRSRQREIEMNRRELNAGNPKTKEEKLRDSCEGFEAMFIQKIWEGMRASLPQDGLTQSRDEKQWQGMYDQELGKSMAKAGGIGLADMMMTQLSRNLQSASDVAASSTARRKPMDIAPAPLLMEDQAAAQEQPRTPMVASAEKTRAGSAMQDMYSAAAPVAAAPTDPEVVALASPETVAAEDNTPPEVRTALNSLATLATQADAARGAGVSAVEKMNGQNQPAPQSAQGQQATTPQILQGTQAETSQNQQAAASQAPRAGTRSAHRIPSDDVHQFTRTQRQTARPDVARRYRDTADMNTPDAIGAEFAQNNIAPTLTGKNVPTAPTDPRFGDAVTDLLKGHLGEPTVKTRL